MDLKIRASIDWDFQQLQKQGEPTAKAEIWNGRNSNETTSNNTSAQSAFIFETQIN